MTDAGFFGQPIKGPLVLLQQLVDANSNHGNVALPGIRAIYHADEYVPDRIYCILDIYASLL